MDENTLSSKKNNSISLARNNPVGLIVGAASFIGSHIADVLLQKNIQVIGVDNLEEGRRENLKKASENKNFHLIIESIGQLNIELERLDYIFITSEHEISLKKILELFKEKKPRLLLLSSVELYGKDTPAFLRWLKDAEAEIAKIASENNLNARVLRLGAVYGPRMSFKSDEPTVRLIQQSLSGDLQKEIPMEFSSRALFIDDCVELSMKCILAGSTAQKIFDGVLPSPIKVAEIKQILMDPVWYDQKGFTPSELPPWTTPNLEKTINSLHWHPKAKLVESLRETLKYFRDNEISVPVAETKKTEVEMVKEEPKGGWKEEKEEEKEKKQGKKLKFNFSKLPMLLAIAFITYALIWPIFELSWGVLTFRYQLSEAVKNLEKGQFSQSLSNIQQASLGVDQAQSIYYSLEPIRQAGFLKSQFEIGDQLSNLATYSSDSAKNTIFGIEALYKSLKSVTGESGDSPKGYFEQSKSYLTSADEDLSKAFALLNDDNFKKSLPKMLEGRVQSLKDRLSLYSGLVKKARAISSLLPEVVALDGSASKNYLVLLQNNNELRPTGGFIGSFALVTFEAGKLKKLDVNDIYAIDGQLKIHVEPPKEIKDDLGQKDYFLRDSNWDPDFPTSARQAEWFYNQETGQRVEGVVALDISAIEDLLSVTGPLDLPDYKETVTSDNLFEKAIAYAETNFFPGTQAKKSFLTSSSQALFNKLFFIPDQNWPGVVSSLGRSLDRKHMSVYLNNPTLFSYLVSQGWTNAMPRAGKESDKVYDFLAPVEANLGANKANYYIDRTVNLETVIGKDGEVNHRLRIAYTNRSPSDAFPGGRYKNRMRVYLPFGTKLNRILWGETDITKTATNLVDYGRLATSFLLELSPKEQKVLVLDYQIADKLEFKDGQAIYNLDVVKQAGTIKDPFNWTLTYPLNFKLASDAGKKIGPQEQTIQTDLQTSKSFEVVFKK